MSDTHDDVAASGRASASADVTVPALQLPPAAPTAADLPLISPVQVPSSPLVRFGGFLGIAGIAIGLIVLLVGCAGYAGALALSPVPVVAGGLGLVLALGGALAQHRRIAEDTHVMQALFATLMSLAGGLLEMAIWLKWPILK
jgi:hypothetical protein